jgi:hypothetical protein
MAAKGSLGKVVVLQPENPFALRIAQLRAAATVAPEDPINLLTYAQGLLAIEGGSN